MNEKYMLNGGFAIIFELLTWFVLDVGLGFYRRWERSVLYVCFSGLFSILS